MGILSRCPSDAVLVEVGADRPLSECVQIQRDDPRSRSLVIWHRLLHKNLASYQFVASQVSSEDLPKWWINDH
jgi:hypothetical protein